MSVVIGILILVVLGGPAVALAKNANRSLKTSGQSSGGKGLGGAKSRSGKAGTAGRGSSGGRASVGKSGRAGGGGTKTARRGGSTVGRGGRSKPSWTLKAWNASGAPKTSETTLGGAGAVLTGKAAGAVTRGGWLVSKKTGRAGRWFAARTLVPFDKWLAKKRAGLETAAAFSDATPIAPDSKPQPAATPPPVFVHPTKKSSKGEPVSGSTTSGAVPSTLAAHVNYINDFEPESDADLLNMMGAEVAGKAAEAEAYMELFDRCVSGHGLDPQAMQGLSDYSEEIAGCADAMKRAHAQFVSVYDAIIEAANNGTVMPHDGRFFSGEANVA